VEHNVENQHPEIKRKPGWISYTKIQVFSFFMQNVNEICLSIASNARISAIKCLNMAKKPLFGSIWMLMLK